ncbi:MAG: hypothetical protein AAB539_01670 [Patescibacteria group bacterium]
MPETFSQKEAPPTQPAETAEDAEKREADINALIELALTKSVEEAVAIARSKSPHLLDELHDRLNTDTYYQKLKELGKLEEL